MTFTIFRGSVQDGRYILIGSERCEVMPSGTAAFLTGVSGLDFYLGQDVILEASRSGNLLRARKICSPDEYFPTDIPTTKHRTGTTLNPKDRKTPLNWRGLWSMTHAIEPPPAEKPPWNTSFNRSPKAITRIVEFLDVTRTPRYQPRQDISCCTIFVSDVTRLLGCEICLDPSGAKRWYNRNANTMIQYIDKVGIPSEGWRRVSSRQEAQALANQGKPVVGMWRNPSGAGHMYMVVPGELDSSGYPLVAQAGAKLFSAGRWRNPDATYITHE
jgi:hypothetical protein